MRTVSGQGGCVCILGRVGPLEGGTEGHLGDGCSSSSKGAAEVGLQGPTEQPCRVGGGQPSGAPARSDPVPVSPGKSSIWRCSMRLWTCMSSPTSTWCRPSGAGQAGGQRGAGGQLVQCEGPRQGPPAGGPPSQVSTCSSHQHAWAHGLPWKAEPEMSIRFIRFIY